MDLHSALLQEHSRAQADRIAAFIGSNAKKFTALINLMLESEYRAVQRASWVVRLSGVQHPQLLQAHLPRLVERLEMDGVPEPVRRNITGLLEEIDLPEPLHGRVMDACFRMLADPGEAIAIRCSAMTVLARLVKTYPEIREELVTAIEDGLQKKPTPAFRARARKVLQHCKREL